MLNVRILGKGNAAKKHKAAIEKLGDQFTLLPDDADADHQVLVIATPNHTHYELVSEHCASGVKYIIVEKPACGSILQATDFVRWEEEHKVHIIPCFQFDFTQGHIRMASGESFNMFLKRDQSYFDSWRGDVQKNLGGILSSHVIHGISAILRSGFPIEAVSAVSSGTMGTPSESCTLFFLGRWGCIRINASFSRPANIPKYPDDPVIGVNAWNCPSQLPDWDWSASAEGYQHIYENITAHEMSMGKVNYIHHWNAKWNLHVTEVLTACHQSAIMKKVVSTTGVATSIGMLDGWVKPYLAQLEQQHEEQN